MSTPSWMPILESLVVDSVTRVTLILGFAVVVYLVARRVASPATRHLLLVATLLGLLAIPVAGFLVPRWSPPVTVPEMSRLVGVAPTLGTEGVRLAPTGEGIAAVNDRQMAPGAESARTQPIPGPRLTLALILSLYVAGVVVLGSRLAVGRLTLRGLRRRSTRVHDPEWTELLEELSREAGVRRPVDLFRTSAALSPVTWGTRRPVILIPAQAESWSPARRRAVLLHELAHIARRDCLAQTVALLASAVYWFHPGIWWITRRMSVEGELACDDRVLAAGTEPEEYASDLLEIARGLSLPGRAITAAGASGLAQLEVRMRAILQRAGVPAPARGRHHRWIVSSLTVLLAALITVDLQGNPEPGRVESFRTTDIAATGGIGQIAGETMSPSEGYAPPDTVSRRKEVSTSVSDETAPAPPQFEPSDLVEGSMGGVDSHTVRGNDSQGDLPVRYTPSVVPTGESSPDLAFENQELSLSFYERPVSMDPSNDDHTAAGSSTGVNCSSTVAFPSCEADSFWPPSERPPFGRRNPIMMGGLPLCPYRVIGLISGRLPSPQNGMNPAIRQARAVGADAVFGFTVTTEMGSNGRLVATKWQATAIVFTDPENPSCYR